MTLIPSLTFTDYEWFPWSICNGCGMPAGNAYPSGHLVPSPILGLANAPIVETKFLELAMSLLDFSPRIPLGTFSILLLILEQMQVRNGTGPGVRRSKRPLLANLTRCNVLWKPPQFGNKVKIGNNYCPIMIGSDVLYYIRYIAIHIIAP